MSYLDQKIYLEALSGQQKGKHHDLAGDTLHLGRSHDNDIILDDKRISRHHAQITNEDGEYFLIDLNTSNGSFINQKRVLNQKLVSGDIIQLGHHVFRFVSPSEDQQGMTSYESSYVPQQERISKHKQQPKSPSSIRPMLYGLFGIMTVLVVFLMMQPTEENENISKSEATSESVSVDTRDLPDIQSEDFSINYEKARGFYHSGYREFLSKNYLRALDDFKAALEIYPEHNLAKIYADKTEKAITQEVGEHYKSAINYYNSAQYKLSIYHFGRVVSLLKNRRPASDFCRQQEEQNLLENEDHERYCESLKKIDQAETKLSETQ